MVQAHRTSSNLLEPLHRKESKVCRVLTHEFGVVQLYRTSLQKKQGVQGAYALIWGGSSASNLLEPSRVRGGSTAPNLSNKVCRVFIH